MSGAPLFMPLFTSCPALLSALLSVLFLSLLPIFTDYADTPLRAQNLPTLGDTGREDLSPVMERKLGEEIIGEFKQDPDYLDDGPVLEYLNDFGAKLLEVHQEARGETGFDFYFFAVRDPVLNAFALPGGFIGVHSSLILAAQNESELAAVLSHEIGHVAQRHIARMIGSQRQDALIPIASMILAALAMRSNPDAAMALAMGGEGVAIQRQLNFSQNAEREADRVGLQIMRDGGFDPAGMVAFFGRMQVAARATSDTMPPFLRTHPLTTERIADIGARIQSEKFKTHTDNPDFQLLRARVRVLQDESVQGMEEAKTGFEDQLAHSVRLKRADPAAKYGMAFIAFRQNRFAQAQEWLKKARADGVPDSQFYTSLQLDILLKSGRLAEALTAAEAALLQFPISRGISRQYTECLIANNKIDEAVRYLRDQTQLYRKEPELQQQLAKAYAAQGKEALQHLALAEAYALSGAVSPALDQLVFARRAKDASYYDLAVIDARERELKILWKDQQDAKKRN